MQHGDRGAITCLAFGAEREQRDYILLATASKNGDVVIYRCYRTDIEKDSLDPQEVRPLSSQGEPTIPAEANTHNLSVKRASPLPETIDRITVHSQTVRSSGGFFLVISPPLITNHKSIIVALFRSASLIHSFPYFFYEREDTQNSVIAHCMSKPHKSTSRFRLCILSKYVKRFMGLCRILSCCAEGWTFKSSNIDVLQFVGGFPCHYIHRHDDSILVSQAKSCILLPCGPMEARLIPHLSHIWFLRFHILICVLIRSKRTNNTSFHFLFM